MNPQKNKYETFCKLSKNKIKGRSIVLLGDNSDIRDAIKEILNVNDVQIATSEIALASKQPDRYKLLNEYDGKVEKYYFFIPFLKYDENVCSKLNGMGYVEYNDFIFFNHPTKVLGPEKIDYCDEYGNNIHTVGGVKIHLLQNAYSNDISVLSKPDGVMSIIAHGVESTVNIENSIAIPNGTMMKIYDNSEVIIKKRTSLGGEFRIDCPSLCKIFIDEDCMISNQIEMIAGDGHSIFDVNTGERINKLVSTNNNIHISKHCWIGWRSLILYGTSIGKSSIVGAGSLVKGKYPNNCIIAGNPAKVIRENISWTRNPYADKIEECGTENIELTNYK